MRVKKFFRPEGQEMVLSEGILRDGGWLTRKRLLLLAGLSIAAVIVTAVIAILVVLGSEGSELKVIGDNAVPRSSGSSSASAASGKSATPLPGDKLKLADGSEVEVVAVNPDGSVATSDGVVIPQTQLPGGRNNGGGSGGTDGGHGGAEGSGSAAGDGSNGSDGGGSAGGGSGSGSGDSNGAGGTDTTDPNAGKTWHPEWYEHVTDVPGHYESRLVEEPWDEELGHFGEKCHTCGADIAGFAVAHLQETGHAGYSTAWFHDGYLHHDAVYRDVWIPEVWHEVYHPGYWE